MVDKSAGKQIVIVGGGSAGWMTASFLSKVLGLAEKESPYTILLVESAEVPSIGVGEATFQTLRDFLSSAGVQEGEFLAATDATFKHGILFKDWLRAPTKDVGDPDQYFHSFESYPPIAPELLVNHWLSAALHGATSDRYDKWAGIQGALAAAGSAPKDWQSKPFEGVVPYGYHVDANKFAHFLKSISMQRGVKHVLGHIEDIAVDASGRIRQLSLRDGSSVGGDFFIDCSGFASILMKRLGAQFVPFSDHLFVDAAVTARIPRAEDSFLRPYTIATAREAGWTFEIQLSNRNGLGYCYSSRHISAETAEQQFRTFLGPECASVSVNHIKTRVGRLQHAWIKNCVAIGLSASFIEPLESTGLYLIELALRLLIDFLDLDGSNELLPRAYNTAVERIFDEVAQFVVMHYILSKRVDTPFWRDISNVAPIPQLDDRLKLWLSKAPSDSDFTAPMVAFRAASFAAILFGMKRLTTIIPGPVRHIPVQKSLSYYETLQTIQRNAVNALPKHGDYLKKYTAAFVS